MAAPRLTQSGADIFVPDGSPLEKALARTTHLCIAAHADDIEFFAWAGIDECFGQRDRWFTGIVVTDGAGSPRSGTYADWTDAQMVEARKAEQRAAAVIGEYSAIVQLSFPSAVVKELGNPAPVDDLVRLLADMRPRKVYLHNPLDRHDTHVAVFLRSLEALRRMPEEQRPPEVYGCEGWRDLDWLVNADRVALSAGGRPHIQAALAGVFDTQISGGKRYDLAVAGRRTAHATFGESHATDREKGVTLALDLAPLLRDPALDPEAYALGFVDRLREDVHARFSRLKTQDP